MIFNLPKVIGHRGVRNLAPENTIQSIKRAIEFNFKWIEIDVKISKDHIPILLHDDTLNRTTSGTGSPLDFKYNLLSKLDAGMWFSDKYKNTSIPTLKQALEYCSLNKINVNIELKPNQGFEQENVYAVVHLIKKININCKYYFSSFDWSSSILIKKLLPMSDVGILIDSIDVKFNINKILDLCKQHNFFSCGFNLKIISKDIVELFKIYGIYISVYSSNNIKKDNAIKLWKIGVNSIFIDDPKAYNDMLK